MWQLLHIPLLPLNKLLMINCIWLFTVRVCVIWLFSVCVQCICKAIILVVQFCSVPIEFDTVVSGLFTVHVIYLSLWGDTNVTNTRTQKNVSTTDTNSLVSDQANNLWVLLSINHQAVKSLSRVARECLLSWLQVVLYTGLISSPCKLDPACVCNLSYFYHVHVV